MRAPRWDNALHAFFAKPLIEARHTVGGGCGKRVATYYDGVGWRGGDRQCRCEPSPELPTGERVDALLVKARAGWKRRHRFDWEWTNRAPVDIPV